jgi:hypothetical protein
MKTTQQPQLPFSNAPIDWMEPDECRFSQLAAVTDAAARAGFEPVRMAVLASGYRLTFQRMPGAGDVKNAPQGSPNAAGKPFREPVTSPASARTTASPDSLQIPNKTFNLHEKHKRTKG